MICNKENDISDLGATSKNKTNTQPAQNNQEHSGDPVNMVTGAFTLDETDCKFPSQRLIVEVTRHYDSDLHNQSKRLGPFGWGWTHSFHLYIEVDSKDGQCTYVDDRGSRLIFKFDQATKEYLSPPGAVGLKLSKKDGGGFSLRQIDGLVAEFNETGHLTAMTRPGPISDSKLHLSYDEINRLTRVVGAGGRSIRFFYEATSPLVRTIVDHTGREWHYKYDKYNNLVQVQDPSGRIRAYSYGYQKVQITNDQGEIEPREIRGLHRVYRFTLNESEKVPEVTNCYTSDYRVYKQINAQGGVTRFDYNRFTRMTYMTDLAGWTFVYGYDRAGNTTKVRLPEGATTEYIYDEHRNLLAEIDPLGNRTEYAELHDPTLFAEQLEFGRRASGNRSDYMTITADDVAVGYDEMGNRTMARDPLGNTYRYLDYTPFGKPSRVILPTGAEILYEYDERSGLPLRMEQQLIVGRAEPLTALQEWQYDDIGNVVCHCAWTENERDELHSARASRFSYDEHGHHPIKQMSWSGDRQEAIFPSEERFQWDELGRVVQHQVIRRNAAADEQLAILTTQFGYDVLDRRIWEIAPNGTALCTIYDIAGNVIEMFMAKDFTPQQPTAIVREERIEHHQWTYDLMGNEIQHIDPAGLVTKRELDERGLCVRITEPTGFTTEFEYDRDGKEVCQRTSLGYEVKTAYDAAGRTIVQKNNAGLELNWVYDAIGRVIKDIKIVNGAESITSYVYDPLGRMVEIKDAEGISEWFEYNEQSNVVRRKKASEPPYIELYSYDGGGRPVEIKAGTENNLQTQFSYRYDDVNRLVETYDALGNTTREFFDSSGNLIRKVDAEGRELYLRYNEAGQLTLRHAADHSVDAKLQYDFAGRLIRAEEGPVVYQWQYDAGGQIVQHQQKLDEKVYSIAYGYDQAGRLVQKRLDDQWWMGFDYETKTPFASRVKIPGHVVDLQIDQQGRVLRESWKNGGRTEYVYEPDGAVKSLSIFDDRDRRIFGQQFTYDNQRRPKNEIRAALNTITQYQYHYNALDRLVQVERGDGLLNDYRRYEYDMMGNRLSEFRDGHLYHTYRYDAANRLQEVKDVQNRRVTYQYDRCGNLTKKDNLQFTYDADQRLRQIHLEGDALLTQFEYSAIGQRVKIKQPDEKSEGIIYDDLQEIQSAASRKTQTSFWRGENSLFAISLDKQELPRRALVDALDSLIGLGGTETIIEFDPYGIASAKEIVPLPFGFNGKRYSLISRFYDSRARFYEPSTGRFTQPDPLGTFDGLNLYQYARSNPIVYVDQLGLKAEKSSQGNVSRSSRNEPRINYKHIFHGEINQYGKAVGLHHVGQNPIVQEAFGRIVPGTRSSENNQGVYTASVEVFNQSTGQWKPKAEGVRGFGSTFFPDSWSRGRVIKEIKEAYSDSGNSSPGPWTGTSSSGMRITGANYKGYEIYSAYPVL